MSSCWVSEADCQTLISESSRSDNSEGGRERPLSAHHLLENLFGHERDLLLGIWGSSHAIGEKQEVVAIKWIDRVTNGVVGLRDDSEQQTIAFDAFQWALLRRRSGGCPAAEHSALYIPGSSDRKAGETN